MRIDTRLISAAAKAAVVAGVLGTVGVSAASASTIVTFNPSAAGLSSQGSFNSDSYSLSDFATATINNATGAFVENGTLQLNTFLLGASTLASSATGLRNGTGSGSYGLYISFSATGTLPGFTPGSPPPSVFGKFSSISYNFLADPGNTDTVSSTGVITDNGAKDITVATGGLDGGINTVGITPAGTPTADVLLTLLKTSLGNSFFAAPPNLGFQETAFTNTTSVITFTNNGTSTILGINGGGGNGTFATIPVPIPEPTSLLILGAGLAGLGVFGRSRRKR